MNHILSLKLPLQVILHLFINRLQLRATQSNHCRIQEPHHHLPLLPTLPLILLLTLLLLLLHPLPLPNQFLHYLPLLPNFHLIESDYQPCFPIAHLPPSFSSIV